MKLKSVLRMLCAGAVVAVVVFSGCGDDGMSGESSGVNDFLSRFSESSDGGTVIVECGDYGYSLAADVNPPHGGTLSVTEGICYSPGTAVNITARPNTDYVFSGWTGASTSNDTTTTITMNGNRTLTANFIKPTVNPSNGGIVTTSGNTATATSNTDYVFSGWSGASTSNSTMITFINNSNHETLTANFIKMNVNPPNTGTVTSVGNSATATPNAGYAFIGWSGADTSKNTTVSITTNSNQTLTANFGYRLTIVQNFLVGYYTVGTVTGAAVYDVNTPANITATSAAGYTFINWTLTSGTATFANGNNAVTTVTLGSNATISANFKQVSGTFTDTRDGTTYRYVGIGNQIWMAENLNYSGDDNNVGACYNNAPDSCAKYGRLYNWATVMNGASSSTLSPSGVRGVCPSGWHVPSDAEWTTLVRYIDPRAVGDWDNDAGTILRSTTGWYDDNNYYIPSTDDFGFSALPAGQAFGYVNETGFHGSSLGVGERGLWWTSTTTGSNSAVNRLMPGVNKYVGRESRSLSEWISLRCVQD